MNVTFACPQCEQTAHADLSSDTAHIDCPYCQSHFAVPPGAIGGVELRRCVVCPGSDLYVRKDFPQRLGVLLVVVGFAASCVAWYYYAIYWTFSILFATAVADVLLYVVCGEALQCYRCGAIYRNVPAMEQHATFSLDVHERYRQEAARSQESGVKVQESGVGVCETIDDAPLSPFAPRNDVLSRSERRL